MQSRVYSCQNLHDKLREKTWLHSRNDPSVSWAHALWCRAWCAAPLLDTFIRISVTKSLEPANMRGVCCSMSRLRYLRVRQSGKITKNITRVPKKIYRSLSMSRWYREDQSVTTIAYCSQKKDKWSSLHDVSSLVHQALAVSDSRISLPGNRLKEDEAGHPFEGNLGIAVNKTFT